MPTNTATGSTFGWLGQNQKQTETGFTLAPTQMGARVYIASLGRFLSVDSTQGGTPNNYVYPPDPINDFDLDGSMGWKSFATIASVGSFIPGPIGMASSALSAAAYAGGILGGLACGASVVCGIAVGAIAAGAAYASSKAGTRQFSWAGASNATALGGVLGAGGGALKASGKIGSAIMRSRVLGTSSKQFGDPSIANKLSAGRAGLLNMRESAIRTGWSVHKSAKYVYPVLRTSINAGRYSMHLNWKYGRFN